MERVTVGVQQAQTAKPLIIGKEWLTSKDGTRLGRLVLSNKLPFELVLRTPTKDIVLPKGAVFNRFPNQKRDGREDADVSVSIYLPADITDELIAMQRATA